MALVAPEIHTVRQVSRPVKVLHILHAFSHGGLENGIVNVINGSPPEIEHELCLLTTAGEFMHRLKRPVRYHELHKRPGNSLNLVLQLRHVIRKSGADIVHTRNWGAFDGVLAACLCPGVAVLHGEHGREIGDPEGLDRLRNTLRRLLGVRVRVFTAVSDNLATWLSDVVGIPRRKIVLIPNGVDTDRYRPHRDPRLRKELGIPDDAFVVGAVGRLDPVKNNTGLIRAFAQLAQRAGPARLVIVGDGPERARLAAAIRDLTGTPCPVLTGYRSDVDRFYGVFDVFVLNSVAEGMSNTLLEAMSSGLSIVCTPVGESRRMITDGETGIFVPVGDDAGLAERLMTCFLAPDLRSRHGANARRRVEEAYSLGRMIRGYVDLYRTVGEGRSAIAASERHPCC